MNFFSGSNPARNRGTLWMCIHNLL